MDRTRDWRKATLKWEQRVPHAQRRTPRPSSRSSSSTQDAWTAQADQLATTLRSLGAFLTSIRRAYLDLGGSSSSSARASTSAPAPGAPLEAWARVRALTDRERDEIDFGVRVALRSALDKLRELEAAENVRVEREAHRSSAAPALVRWLGGHGDGDGDEGGRGTSEHTLAAHRKGVTLFLTGSLKRVSDAQRALQEQRVERERARTSTLADSAAATVATTAKAAAHSTSSNGGVLANSSYKLPIPQTAADDDDEPPLESVLTPAQVQQFEQEESAMLRAAQTDLAAIEHAERSLVEIAHLQTQLARELAAQTDKVDALYGDAIATAGKVGDANVQLRQARERNRESRTSIIVFIMIASFAILFLDFYAD